MTRHFVGLRRKVFERRELGHPILPGIVVDTNGGKERVTMTTHTIGGLVPTALAFRRSVVRPALAAIVVAGTMLTGGCQSPSAVAGPDPSMVSSTGAAAIGLAGGVAVSCAPGQQTLVRQAVVNGQSVAQVACVGHVTAPAIPDAAWAGSVTSPQAIPVTTSMPAVYRTAAADDEVVYQRPVRRTVRRSERTWQKSAVIIGSSAGVGAGLGGLMGGKKGALIGAAVGGGGAAIWDQVTRRRQ